MSTSDRRQALHREIAAHLDAMAELIDKSGLSPTDTQLKVSADELRTEAEGLRRGATR